MEDNIPEQIESLRKERSPNEIEEMLLSGQLGKIFTYGNYHFAGGYKLSHLTIEIYHPGFIKYNTEHLWKLIVHHRDSNSMNDSYENLKVIRRDHHHRMHMFRYYSDPNNKKANEKKKKKVSVTMRKHYKWISPEQIPELFNNWFTIKEYAQLSKVSYRTAYGRLDILVTENQIIRKSKVVDSHNCCIFRTPQGNSTSQVLI